MYGKVKGHAPSLSEVHFWGCSIHGHINYVEC